MLYTEAGILLIDLQLLFFREVIFHLEELPKFSHTLSINHARRIGSTAIQPPSNDLP